MVRNNTRGSLPAWEKPVDQGSNPCVPTPHLWKGGKSARISPSGQETRNRHAIWGFSGKLIQKASWTFEQSSRNPDPFPFGFSRRTRAISCLKVSDKPFKAHSSRSIAGRPKHGESQEIQEN